MKKYLILALSAVILATAVSGSVAFFTDSVTANSVIASGSIDIVQHEYEREVVNGAYTTTLRPFTQKQQLFPSYKLDQEQRVTITVDGHAASVYNTGAKNFVDKIVNVENVGKSSAYVRTFVAIPAYYPQGSEEGVTWLNLDQNRTDWTWSASPIRSQTIAGAVFDVYTAVYNKPLLPGEITPPSLLGFSLDSRTGSKNGVYTFTNDRGTHMLGSNPVMTILVTTEATQANPDVFASAQEAFTAAFDKDNTAYHPWNSMILATSQSELDAALASNAYDMRIGLKAGEYTLPAKLPAGIQLIGWDKDVVLAADASGLTASNVEMHNLTIKNDVAFKGFGSFQHIAFKGTLKAEITSTTLFDGCTYAVAPNFSGQTELVRIDGKGL